MPTNSSSDIIYTSEKVPNPEANWEQIKFIFRRITEFLISHKLKLNQEMKQRLDNLKNQYPQLYQELLSYLHQNYIGPTLFAPHPTSDTPSGS